MELYKITLLGAYLSFLWFIPLLWVIRKPLDWKIKKLRLFTFIPTIGAFLFVIGFTIKLFIDKKFIQFDFNELNVFILLFLFLQITVTLFMEITLNLYTRKSNEFSKEHLRRFENQLIIGLTLLFALDVLVRFQIFHMTF
ncbi:hypothetical protein MZM54_02305 [[Brevibacterium] frigoritolerans]|nr:hypothetical protein [Peribacillus frigoritolerans]